jgi:hypothetical protein
LLKDIAIRGEAGVAGRTPALAKKKIIINK